ncbi:urease accessory protein UreF [Deinococcus altitudinis]|uniref:urease accessory protein UreF n=1 Tax=Deinococcus altitudinis TaxID=468914 RepID=UPI0038913277
MSLPLLRLLQLADSAFPAGAYAFSDGLETLVARGRVSTAGDLHAFLHGQLAQGWGRCDPAACALSWAGADHTELDDLLDLLKPVAGPRLASTRVGHNLQRAALKLWPERLEGFPPVRHQATAFGAVARRLEAGQRGAVTAYVGSFLLGRATSATRMMRLGGLDAQRVVSRLEAEAAACVQRALEAGPGDLGSFAPELDVAAAEQEGLDVRLFQS